MKKWISMCLVLTLAMLPCALSGCQTYGESAGLGAALGAGAGAIIGNQSGSAGEGALIGAAVGGLSGLVVHDVRANRAKSREATVTQYSYQPTQGEMLTLENAQVLPSEIIRGNFGEASIQYALLGTGNGAQVRETRILRRGDEVVSQLSSKSFTRTDGTWVSTIQFKIPDSLEPGTYVLEQVVNSAQGSTISSNTPFQVR